MKKIPFLLIALGLCLTVSSEAQIKVSSSGKVGINNTSPSYQLDVDGNFRVKHSGNSFVYSYSNLYPVGFGRLGSGTYLWDELYAYNAYFYYYTVIMSDEKNKTDIKDMGGVKDKFKQLRPVNYKLKPKFKGNNESDDRIAASSEREQMGLIAQEVREVYPDIVVENEEGELGIQYTALVPILIKAIQEQQAEIDDLRSRLEKIESKK